MRNIFKIGIIFCATLLLTITSCKKEESIPNDSSNNSLEYVQTQLAQDTILTELGKHLVNSNS